MSLQELVLAVEQEADSMTLEVLNLWLLRREQVQENQQLSSLRSEYQKLNSLRLMIITAHHQSLIATSDVQELLDTLHRAFGHAEGEWSHGVDKTTLENTLPLLIAELRDLRHFCDDYDQDYHVLSEALVVAQNLRLRVEGISIAHAAELGIAC